MSGLRDRLLRLKNAQVAQEERLAGMVTSAETSVSEEGAVIHGDEQADAAPVGAAAAEADDDTLTSEWDELGVRIVQSTEGAFLVRESRYPLTHKHGIHELIELSEAQINLDAFRKPDSVDLGYTNLLFLDLETTGLGVGAGNVPFMVGLAYLQDDVFIVEQMLIRHPAEERAMIGYLCNLLPSFTHLVTYNGRTFDWPVLFNRFILNGFRHFKWEPIHIDLLHPSRAVWRNTLVSCRLSHVEEERLGIIRHDDVPGSLAPAIYFQYLADRKPEPLLGVFLHNEIDMLSLAALAIRFGHLLGGRIGTGTVQMPEEAEELLRTGLWLEKMGKSVLAEPLYAAAAEHPRPTIKGLCLLAERDKKCGNWQRAVLLWQKAIDEAAHAAWPDYEAHIELAMYYEHKTKQLAEALKLAETAFAIAQKRLTGVRLKGNRRTELDVLRKRIDRLRMKINRISEAT